MPAALPLRSWMLALALTTVAHAEILLHGAVKNGDTYLVSVADGAKAAPHWLPIGSEFAGYKLTGFDADRGILTVEQKGAKLEVSLPKAQVKSAQTTVADLQQMTEAELESLGFHLIQAGETGARIARAEHITIANLRALNPTVNFAKLKVGQILVISPGP